MAARFFYRLVFKRHVVLDAHRLELGYTNVNVKVFVGQVSLSPRRVLRQDALIQKVERSSSRRFKEEPFHRANTSVGPIRQEHQRHWSPISVKRIVKLPHGPPTPVGLPNLIHRRYDVVVLGVGFSTFVSGVVPPAPTRNFGSLSRLEDAPGIASIFLRLTKRQSS